MWRALIVAGVNILITSFEILMSRSTSSVMTVMCCRLNLTCLTSKVSNKWLRTLNFFFFPLFPQLLSASVGNGGMQYWSSHSVKSQSYTVFRPFKHSKLGEKLDSRLSDPPPPQLVSVLHAYKLLKSIRLIEDNRWRHVIHSPCIGLSLVGWPWRESVLSCPDAGDTGKTIFSNTNKLTLWPLTCVIKPCTLAWFFLLAYFTDFWQLRLSSKR